MRDVLPELLSWWTAGATVGLATVVATWESAPRPPGAAMLVGPDGSVVGSVSGGCVEADVYARALQVLEQQRPVLQSYGVTDADAAAVGLPCGGTLDVFVEPVSRSSFPELGRLAEEMMAGRPVAVATLVEHPDELRHGRRLVVPAHDGLVEGGLGSPGADAAVTEDVHHLLPAGRSELLTYGPDGERLAQGMAVFAACYPAKPRMLVFGASDFAAALVKMGSFLGYAVTVCDARSVFTTANRFPDAAEVVVDWPHRYLAAEAAAGRVDADTVVCVLSHDPKFEVPLLEVGLRLPQVGYLGAMGSRRTVATRHRELREAGVGEHELRRLSTPLGLDLGARTPEETAVSIAAEIISLRRGGRGARLAELDGRIHH